MKHLRTAWRRWGPAGYLSVRRSASIMLAALVVAFAVYGSMPLVRIWHLPAVYAHRGDAFTANVTGWMPRYLVRDAHFRVNRGAWRPVGRGWPRASGSTFAIELPTDALRRGANVLEIQAHGWLRPSHVIEREFRYDSTPVVLPVTTRWTELDVQDGRWETVDAAGGTRVRPMPGTEGYDRIIAVTGSFRGERRVETDVVFRHHTVGRFHRGAREYGFGILSLWGGHPDVPTHRPRRGWRFALSWFWSKPGGVGNEISHRYADRAPSWVNGYRDFVVEPAGHYEVVVETRRLRDDSGAPYFAQRTKWWRRGKPKPSAWLNLESRVEPPLPDGEYAVALIAFNCQVEFGPVRVSRPTETHAGSPPVGRLDARHAP